MKSRHEQYRNAVQNVGIGKEETLPELTINYHAAGIENSTDYTVSEAYPMVESEKNI